MSIPDRWKQDGQVHRSGLNWPVIVARVLAVLECFVLALLATDAFSEGHSFISQFGDFLIHLAPAFILIGATTWAWFKPGQGGWIFIGLAGAYLAMAKGAMHPLAHLIITLPLLVSGGLFLVSGRKRQ